MRSDAAEERDVLLLSERDDFETGNEFEVPDVQRGHIEAKMQGCGSDNGVLEGDAIALGSLFAFDASGKLRDLQSHRMHDQIVEGSLGEDAPPFAVGVGLAPVDAMRQFHDADSRERDIDLAMPGPRLAEDVFDGLSMPFACNEDAGIENQTHADVSRGLRLRMISSMSAANPASITGL